MNIDNTIKNWKWWLLMPVVLPVFCIILIPKAIIFVLEMIIAVVELVNIGDRPTPIGKKILDWVHDG